MLVLLLVGCGGGTWELETWGEEYIEDGIPAEAFADGCSVTYDTFLVNFTERALHDGDGEHVGAIEGAQVYDLTQAGPHLMGSAEVPATHYDEVEIVVGPAVGATAGNATDDQVATMNDLGASVWVSGTLTCATEATFAWSFDTDTAYACEPDDLTVPAGGVARSQSTIHGDHLFYDGLEDPDAVVRGEAIVAADADGDGEVTQAELAAVPVAGLGYDVGQYSDVTDLAQFVAFLTRTLGHIDGEGHCQVEL